MNPGFGFFHSLFVSRLSCVSRALLLHRYGLVASMGARKSYGAANFFCDFLWQKEGDRVQWWSHP